MGRGTRQQPEHQHIGRGHQQQAPEDRTLTHAGGGVLQFVQAGAPGDEAVDGPAGEAEEAQLLAGRGIDRQAVGVVGVALRGAHLLGLAVVPDGAIAQQPMGREPSAGKQQRRPPGVPRQDHGRCHPAGHLDQAGGDEVHGDRKRRPGHPQIEVAGHGQVAGQRRIFQMPNARRAHAGLGEPVVEPGGGAIAQVGAECLMNGAEHLQEHKDRARKGQRPGQRMALLHRAHQHAHGNGEGRRQDAAQQQHRPPASRQTRIRLGQHGEKLPFLARRQRLQHDRILREDGAQKSSPYNTESRPRRLSMRDVLERQIDQAMGRQPADLVVRNARILNLVTGELQSGDIAVCGSLIVGTFDSYRGVEEIDAQGRFAVPGFIDSHVHCESTLVTPLEFDRCVLPHGVTTAICDPHEISNVLGLVGLQYFLDAAEHTALDLRVQLSSCVPATNLETSGARLTAADLVPHRHHPKVIGLAEFMNVPGVLNKDPECMEKLAAFAGQHIDGHAPLLSGHSLNAYLSCGIRNCHETTNLAEGGKSWPRACRC